MTKMTDLDLDTLKLEPGTPELTDAAPADVAAVMAYSQAVSLKRIADALEVLTARETAQRDHDRAKAFAETAAALDAQQAADQPGADSEGWIPWHGTCPVDPDDQVDFRMRDGSYDTGVAHNLDWSHCDSTRGAAGGWEIVAYRIHKD